MDDIYSENAVLWEDNATDIDMSTNISDHDVDANTFDHVHSKKFDHWLFKKIMATK